MRFLYQTVTTDPALKAEADALSQQLRDEDFLSPDHLVITLRDHFERHGLDRRVVLLAGAITINSPQGLLLRIRSTN